MNKSYSNLDILIMYDATVSINHIPLGESEDNDFIEKELRRLIKCAGDWSDKKLEVARIRIWKKPMKIVGQEVVPQDDTWA